MSAAIEAVRRVVRCRIVPVALILPVAGAAPVAPAQAAAHTASPGFFADGPRRSKII